MQAGFGYQQQLVPGMRPGGGPMPSFFVPMVQQGQQGQRPGGRRGTGPVQQPQQPMPMMQQQVCSCTEFPIFLFVSHVTHLHACLMVRYFLICLLDASKGACLSLPSWPQHARCPTSSCSWWNAVSPL